MQSHSDHFDEAVPCVIVAIGSTIPEIEQVTDPKADLRCYACRQSEITVKDEFQKLKRLSCFLVISPSLYLCSGMGSRVVMYAESE